MEQKQFELIADAVEEAENSVVPFPVIGDELAVAGDANETKIHPHNYKITFRVPKDGKYVHKTVEYKDVYITPRQDTKIVKALTAIIPYFRKIKLDGDVENLPVEDRMVVFESLGDDFFDACYDVVATVLRIDQDLKDYMMPGAVLDATAQIINDFPEAVNEADTFFGKSSVNQ